MEEPPLPATPTPPSTNKRTPALLRLFRSDLFSAWMGLQYLLTTPPHHLGTHYYLCNRLRGLPTGDLLFLIPQLCHLLVVSRRSAVAVECLVLEWCRRDVHVGVQVLWLLESYLADCNSNSVGGTCQELKQRIMRLMTKVQQASFTRTPTADHKPAPRRRRSSFLMADSPDSGLDDLPAVSGTLLGFGLCLLSFSAPQAYKAMRPLALMEAKTPRFGDIQAALRHAGVDCGQRVGRLPVPFTAPAPTVERLHLGTAFQPVSGAPVSGALVSGAPADSKRAGLYHPEMHFISALLEVSKRICIVPGKESRQRALHAELNLVNHNLPVDFCLPLLCRCDGDQGGHHRIVRIPSHEATILNSAERVPFLVFIEVLLGDQDLTGDDLRSIRAHSGTASLISSFSASDCTSGSGDSVDLIEARTPLFPPATLDGEYTTTTTTTTTSTQPPGEQMRLAAIMLAQLNRQAAQPNANHKHIDDIRQRLLSEIERLERDGMIDALARLEPAGDPAGAIGAASIGDTAIGTTTASIGDTTTVGAMALDPGSMAISMQPQVIRDDPSAAVFSESFEDKSRRIRAESPFGHLPSWALLSVVVKQGQEMRQEHFACQLIAMMRQIWLEEGISDLWTSNHHKVLVAGPEGGLVETIPNCISVHSIKKAALQSTGCTCTLKQYYTRQFGGENTSDFKSALLHFITSLAAYSLITYTLHIKDRHNGNILVDRHGHIIHIDFGFMLTNAPGGNVYGGGLETAPFKLTHDYVELLGSRLNSDSPEFVMFRALFMAGLLALRKHHERLVLLVEATSTGFSGLPCFQSREQVVAGLKARLFLASTDRVVEQNVDRLITSSAYNMFTRLYDSFQYYSNGIL